MIHIYGLTIFGCELESELEIGIVIEGRIFQLDDAIMSKNWFSTITDNILLYNIISF